VGERNAGGGGRGREIVGHGNSQGEVREWRSWPGRRRAGPG
jgi:hypothetical protein